MPKPFFYFHKLDENSFEEKPKLKLFKSSFIKVFQNSKQFIAGLFPMFLS